MRKHLLLMLATAMLGATMAFIAPGPSSPVSPAPADASTCAITNPYSPQNPQSGVQVIGGTNNGFAQGCILVIITHTCAYPQLCPFWFTWYIQETVDPYYPDSAGCAKAQYRKAFVAWINTKYPEGYDCNSVDSTMSSGYMLIDPSYGGNGYDPNFQTRIQLSNGYVATLTEWHMFQ